MIYFFTGKPRNGKSLHMAEIIYKSMKRGRNVIANFEINEHAFDRCLAKKKGTLGKFLFMDNKYWLNNAYLDKRRHEPINDGTSYSYLDGLLNYALQFHKRNNRGQILEHQTLLVLDECQELFNTRSWNRKDRLLWCAFFRQHGKLGYDVYLISQDDMVIDKQIRSILQDEYEHRCINNYKFFGKILGLLAGGKLFVCIRRTYMLGKRTKESKQDTYFFRGRKKYYEFYDSYKLFQRAGNPGAPAEG